GKIDVSKTVIESEELAPARVADEFRQLVREVIDERVAELENKKDRTKEEAAELDVWKKRPDVLPPALAERFENDLRAKLDSTKRLAELDEKKQKLEEKKEGLSKTEADEYED